MKSKKKSLIGISQILRLQLACMVIAAFGGVNTVRADVGLESMAKQSVAGPDLALSVVADFQFGYAIDGAGGEYVITVQNIGTETQTGNVSVTIDFPNVSYLIPYQINGTGWSCTPLSPDPIECTRTDDLDPPNSYQPIILTFDVETDAPNSFNTLFGVVGDGEPVGNTGNNIQDFVTSIKKSDLVILSTSLSSYPLLPNEPFDANIVVKNQGTNLTESYAIGFVFIDIDPGDIGPDEYGCLDLSSLDSDPTDGYADFYSKAHYNIQLTPNAQTTIPVSIENGLTSGPHDIYYYVDAGCINNEISELNNSYGPMRIQVGSVIPSNPTLLVNSVLPTSRTPVIGNPVTIFNTVINAGSEYAAGVTLSLGTALPGSFSYSQTSCSTNAIIGSPNAPIDIPPGGVACYILTFTPSSVFPATHAQIVAQALNAPATTLLVGINTWLLRSTSSPGPDIIALTTTADFHQIACSGTNAFAVALSNVGAATIGDITVTANTGSVSLPISVSIMETNPSTGTVIGDNILQGIGAGNNRTVAVFVNFTDCVLFNPAANRIFIEFRDASNNVVGSTSTAVSTNR